jgi:hypothetical protein
MRKLISMLTLAASVTAASPAFAQGALAVGAWCLTNSISNGWDNLNKEYIPRTNTYERVADCPAESRVVIRRHSLDGLEFHTDGKVMVVEGWPKPRARRSRASKGKA